MALRIADLQEPILRRGSAGAYSLYIGIPVLPLPVQLLQLCQLQSGPGPQTGTALCGLFVPGGGGHPCPGR